MQKLFAWFGDSANLDDHCMTTCVLIFTKHYSLDSSLHALSNEVYFVLFSSTLAGISAKDEKYVQKLIAWFGNSETLYDCSMTTGGPGFTKLC